MIVSYIVILSLAFIKYKELNLYFYIISIDISIYILYFYAPVESKNKLLDELEFKVYRKRIRMIIGVIVIIGCLLLKIGYFDLFNIE